MVPTQNFRVQPQKTKMCNIQCSYSKMGQNMSFKYVPSTYGPKYANYLGLPEIGPKYAKYMRPFPKNLKYAILMVLHRNCLNLPLTLFLHGKGKICHFVVPPPKKTQYAIYMVCAKKRLNLPQKG